MSQTAALYHLQSLDSQIDSIRARLDQISKLLNQNAAVRGAQTALAEAEELSRRWQSDQHRLESERAQLQDEARETEERLYSGKVHNPRELGDLQDKLAELNRRIAGLEEPVLAAMVAVEDSASAIKQAQEALELALADQNHAMSELTAERAGLDNQLQQLLAQAEQARARIDPAHLQLYARLRQRPGGVAVSLLKGDACAACGVEITTRQAQMVQHGDVLTCPTCGRILHAA